MPMVPGTPSYGYGGWGTSPHSGAGFAGMYQWGLLIGSAAIGLTAVGRAYRIMPILTSKPRRFFWGVLIGAQGSVAPDQILVADADSLSGGGGPGGDLTSAVPPSITSGGAPPSAEGLGRLINSAHGGGRSGAKPRKRCPPGFRWDGRRCVRKG